jgi:flotillin
MSLETLSAPLMLLNFNFGAIALIVVPVLLVMFFVTILVRQYRRCPSNRILVVYGKVTGQRAAKCLHGGGTFVVPLLQNYAYLNLEPMTIEIELTSALSKKNIRVNAPSTFTIGISTHPDIMNNAAERLLGLSDKDVAAQARDIILGQMRLVIATLSIEEINQDREKFLDLVNKNVSTEINKIGLELINVNVRDITDESGYIEALGRKAASEAINTAKVEVAEADRNGSIGAASANREMQVQVAEQHASRRSRSPNRMRWPSRVKNKPRRTNVSGSPISSRTRSRARTRPGPRWPTTKRRSRSARPTPSAGARSRWRRLLGTCSRPKKKRSSRGSKRPKSLSR